mgnify:FL=1
MPGVKSARIKADRIAEMVRMLKLHPELTNKQLGKMFSVNSSLITEWKRKAGLLPYPENKDVK